MNMLRTANPKKIIKSLGVSRFGTNPDKNRGIIPMLKYIQTIPTHPIPSLHSTIEFKSLKITSGARAKTKIVKVCLYCE